MNQLFSRTSVTVDEAVAILLGVVKGPVEYRVLSEDPSPEELDSLGPLVFSLQEYLQEELDNLESDLVEARADNMPSAKIIAEKQAAIQAHDAVTEKAKSYLCDINDELNKGDRSALRVDTKLSNTANTYITLSSFDAWATQYGRSVLAKLQKTAGITLPVIHLQPDALAKPQPRMKMRDQEDAILGAIKELGFDPTVLPPRVPAKRGVKSVVRDRLAQSPLFKRPSAFKNAWDRLRDSNKIVEAAILL